MANVTRQSALTYIPIAAAVLIMVVSAVVQGQWSERWGTFPELQLYAQQLDKIPKSVGDWRGEDAEKSTEQVLKIAGAEGEFVRVYKNSAGQSVRVSIICARLRDVFYHTPDRCYPAAGFEMLGEPQEKVVELANSDKSAAFFTTTFQKSEPTGTHNERGYWSWSGDGSWIAPKNPKLKFAGQKALYKMYVFAAVPQGKKGSDEDYSVDFIRAFVPALDVALGPAFHHDGTVPAAKPAEAPVTVPAAAEGPAG